MSHSVVKIATAPPVAEAEAEVKAVVDDAVSAPPPPLGPYDHLVQDYIREGELGREMMIRGITKIRSTTTEEEGGKGEKKNSLWSMQIYLDFPWLDVVCTHLRCQGSAANYMSAPHQPIPAVDVLSVLMATQDIAFWLICGNVTEVYNNPPLWLPNWKGVIKHIALLLPVILKTRERECKQAAETYTDACAVYLREPADASGVDFEYFGEDVMHALCESTLSSYIRSWEFAFGKLCEVIHAASSTLAALQREGETPQDPAQRARDLDVLAGFMKIEASVLELPFHSSSLYRQLMDDPTRYVFTLGFHVYHDRPHVEREQLESFARIIRECNRRIDKIPDVRVKCEERIRGYVITLLNEVVEEIHKPTYDASHPPPPPMNKLEPLGEEKDTDMMEEEEKKEDFVVVEETGPLAPLSTEF
jgi:hypothetical protein